MNVFDILNQVHEASGKNDKIAILTANNSNSQLRELLFAALSFSKKFNIKSFNEWKDQEFETEIKDRHHQFMGVLQQLENRSVTGGAARLVVEDFFRNCSQEERLWYARVLRKDLGSGFSISTANKAGFKIPKFDVMLAKDGAKCKKLDKIIEAGVYVSPKLDGYRCIAVCNNGDVKLYSRNGKTYDNFPALERELSGWCRNKQFVLDGEIMSGDFSQMQQSAFASTRGTIVGDVKFHVFGYIGYEEWQTQNFKASTGERLQARDSMHLEHPALTIVKHTYLNSVDEVLTMQRQYESEGYEGAMLLPDCPYFLGRKSNKLLKLKTMQSQDCIIKSVNEGNKKYSGSFGSFTVQQENGEFCNVGSGFSDEERYEIWSNPTGLVNRIIEVKYQDLSNDGVMRFPIFLRFRDNGAGTGKI